MDFIDGSIGVYRPIMMFFDSSAYRNALTTCWNFQTYMMQIGLLTELLRLQQNNLIPPEVTTETMTELLVEETNKSLKIKLWEFEVEECFEAYAKLTFEVNTSMRMRDIEFEARRLLDSPEMVPPQLKHPEIINKAQQLAGNLKQQDATCAKIWTLYEIVIEVLPKVLQGFWFSPPKPHFSMPSLYLSKMAVGVTQAVLDFISLPFSMNIYIHFSKLMRDNVVLSIKDKVSQLFPLDEQANTNPGFQPELLKTITHVAVREICLLSPFFTPFLPTPSVPFHEHSPSTVLPLYDEDLSDEFIEEPNSAQSTLALLLSSDESDIEEENTTNETTINIVSTWLRKKICCC
ncbi:uncharacterized protein [Syngnathus scovelli]|uniref:uncharacterized protein isoform X2 n=1 Tax=Syngnathus scovelli TaxID=161590 RepID=UPI0021101DFF|nr:uncharacterized protein LOC125974926 isoform X2 [Syngnathus scovelli]